jgi:hypothetical protein
MLTSRCILIARDGISRSLKKPERERVEAQRKDERERERERDARIELQTGDRDGLLFL